MAFRVMALLVAVISLAACGNKEKKTSTPLSIANIGAIGAEGIDGVALKILLFDPKDLSADFEAVASEMNAFHIKVTGSQHCNSEDTLGAFSADVDSYYTALTRDCDYTIDIEYGNAATPPPLSSDPTAPGQDTSLVSFQENIKTITDGSCAISGCHAAGSTLVSLDSYANVKGMADSSINRISKAAGTAGLMPPTGPLTKDQIELFTAWKAAGFPESSSSLKEQREEQTLDKVYYKVTAALSIKRDYLADKKSVTIFPTMQLTSDGKAVGLSIEQIQGKEYKRGQSAKPADTSSVATPVIESSTPTDITPIPEVASPTSNTEPVTFAQIQPLMSASKGNCLECHGDYADITVLAALKSKILERVVYLKNMPLDKRALSDSERAIFKAWYEGGAKP